MATAMDQKAGEKWTASVNFQPKIPRSDRLLASSRRVLQGGDALLDRRMRCEQLADVAGDS